MRRVAAALGGSRTTIITVQKRAAEMGLTHQKASKMSNKEVSRELFPARDIRDILEIINARHKRASTIFCSQFAPEGWHDKLNDPVVADAICDRIVHDSYKITIHGDGMRKRKGIKES